MKRIIAGVGLALSLSLAVPGSAQAQTKIGVSYQPSLYWALPWHYATVKGWWKEVGLAPEFSTFPAGAPQIAASAAKSWDVGGTGSVPAVLGAVRFNILTIGITNDESKANAMMVRGDKFDAIKADPKSLKGQRLLLTTNSTADFAARKCLAKFGLASNDMQFVNLGQAQIVTAITSNNGDVAGVWAPNTYTLEDRANAKYLCSGADAGAIVPGALIVRADFAKERPEDVAKFLAVYLRGWSWAKANMAEAQKLALDFYKQGGLEATPKAMEQEFALRPTFALDEQLKLMARNGGASQVDGWFSEIGKFMAEVGTIPTIPEAKSYLTDDFLKRVAADPKLKAFATEFDKK
ncbi:nitrate ABC transporter substrate-binding protein [Bosea sp. Root483D1]|uniref:ABC transporter substrate-binding protein n=1 Tax=Bosea sp. Root483D1 TaxID=1736544 RepID=UPI00070EC322|nr:ABC transporter substrate-binding protein [Bosea sp. Root483D1]KRE24421.1 nitrate ABC transporter substrate-binding protein [Bosea sp. Root483D1]